MNMDNRETRTHSIELILWQVFCWYMIGVIVLALLLVVSNYLA